jgi:N-acetylglutamate synthase-like GNAT family acetyltransferase
MRAFKYFKASETEVKTLFHKWKCNCDWFTSWYFKQIMEAQLNKEQTKPNNNSGADIN